MTLEEALALYIDDAGPCNDPSCRNGAGSVCDASNPDASSVVWSSDPTKYTRSSQPNTSGAASTDASWCWPTTRSGSSASTGGYAQHHGHAACTCRTAAGSSPGGALDGS